MIGTVIIYTICGFIGILTLWIIVGIIHALKENALTSALANGLTLILAIAGSLAGLIVSVCVTIWLVKLLL